MNLKERFLDYWHTDIAYSDYTYDLSIFEQIIYGLFGVVFGIIAMVVIIGFLPIWIVPYLIYKNMSIKRIK